MLARKSLWLWNHPKTGVPVTHTKKTPVFLITRKTKLYLITSTFQWEKFNNNNTRTIIALKDLTTQNRSSGREFIWLHVVFYQKLRPLHKIWYLKTCRQESSLQMTTTTTTDAIHVCSCSFSLHAKWAKIIHVRSAPCHLCFIYFAAHRIFIFALGLFGFLWSFTPCSRYYFLTTCLCIIDNCPQRKFEAK